MKFSHTSEPSVRPQRKSSQPHDDLFIKIATSAFITLTSPLWIPLWILLLPFGRRRERQKREEHLVQAAIRASMPKEPPPPTDPELEQRRELAMRTNKHIDPRLSILYDPISDDPAYAWSIKEAGRRAKEEIDPSSQMGSCHLFWRRKQEILKQDYGIVWYSPREMNPGSRFD